MRDIFNRNIAREDRVACSPSSVNGLVIGIVKEFTATNRLKIVYTCPSTGLQTIVILPPNQVAKRC